METIWLVLLNNYVIDKIIVNEGNDINYPIPGVSFFRDIDGKPGIGDWYEVKENIFYRPLSIPPDFTK